MMRFRHLRPACAIAWATCCAVDAIPAPIADTPIGRHIIVADTSFSMARRKGAMMQAISNIIETGLNGHIKDSDRVEVWMFHERVDIEDYPPFLWRADQAGNSAKGVVAFIQRRRFGNQTRMENLIPILTAAASESPQLTIVIVSDGDTDLVNTPFDRSINLVYRDYGRSLRKARQPFITILRARNGTFAAWSIIRGGDSIQVPALPPVRSEKSAPAAPSIVAPAVEPAPEFATPLTEAPETISPEPRSDAVAQPSLKPPSIQAPNKPEATSSWAEKTERTPRPLAQAADSVEAVGSQAKETRSQTSTFTTDQKPLEPMPNTNRAARPQGPATSGGPTSPEAEETRSAISNPQARKTSPSQELLRHSTRATNNATTAEETPHPGQSQPLKTNPGLLPPTSASRMPASRVSTNAVDSPDSHPLAFLIGGMALLGLAGAVLAWSLLGTRAKGQPSMISRSMSHRDK